jgi:hypothetical protein
MGDDVGSGVGDSGVDVGLGTVVGVGSGFGLAEGFGVVFTSLPRMTVNVPAVGNDVPGGTTEIDEAGVAMSALS